MYSLRNFALGTIYLSVNCEPDLKIEGLCSSQEQCVRYFKHYHRKSACFGDIRSYVANLAKADQEIFLKDINAISDVGEVICYKFNLI